MKIFFIVAFSMFFTLSGCSDSHKNLVLVASKTLGGDPGQFIVRVEMNNFIENSDSGTGEIELTKINPDAFGIAGKFPITWETDARTSEVSILSKDLKYVIDLTPTGIEHPILNPKKSFWCLECARIQPNGVVGSIPGRFDEFSDK